MHAYLCFPTLPMPNTLIKFRFANTFKLLLTNYFFFLIPNAYAIFLSQYLNEFKIHFTIILWFRVKLGYKGLSNAYLLSNNLVLVLKDLVIIKKKLQKNLVLSCVT